MEEREYNGYIYRRSGPGQQWQMVGPATPQQSAPRGQVFSLPKDPTEAATDAVDLAIKRQQLVERGRKPYRMTPQEVSQEGLDPAKVYYRNADGVPTPVAGQEKPPAAGKPLREGDGNKLTANVSTYEALKGAYQSFQPNYAGNTITGDLENWAGALNSSWATPGQRDWWANFRQTDNIIRNSLYGASLTDGEKRAYDSTTIQPSMDPKVIQQNLARRAEIVRRAVARQVNRFKVSYNNDEIDAITGSLGEDFSARTSPVYHGDVLTGTGAPVAAGEASGGVGGPVGGIGGGGGATTPGGGPSLGPRGERLLGADEQVSFNGDAKPITGYRLPKDQEAQVIAALRSGDVGQAAAIFERYSGIPANRAELATAAEQIRKNPAAPVSLNYGNSDAYAQSEADRRRFGTQLPQAMRDRANASPVDVSGRSFANGILAGLPDYLAAGAYMPFRGGSWRDNLMREQALTEADARLHPSNSFLSTLMGGALGAAIAETKLAALGSRLPGALGAVVRSPRTADALYGAVSAATDSRGDPSSIGLGAASGLGGGILGRGVAKGVGGVVGGVRNAAVNQLRERGIPLTVGQTLGGVAKGIEDRLTGVPIIGDIVRNRRLDGLRSFNRSAFDEGLAPFGDITNPAPSNTGGLIGEEGVDAARAARSQAYSNTLDPVRVRADAPYINDTRATLAAGNRLPQNMQGGEGDIGYTLGTRVGQSFDANGYLTGRDYQQALRGLRRDARSVENKPYGYDFGNVTRQAEGDLYNLLDRQAPGVAQDLTMVNGANRNVEILRDAVNRARNGTRTGEAGVFSPSQLSDAAAANAKRFGGTQGTTNQPFFDLTRAGQDVLPSSVPDSGTAGRLATLALPGLLGGGAGYLGGDTQSGALSGVALGAALAAGGSRTGQKFLVNLLAERPDLAREIGTQIQNRAALGGMFGAPLLVDATTR